MISGTPVVTQCAAALGQYRHFQWRRGEHNVVQRTILKICLKQAVER